MTSSHFFFIPFIFSLGLLAGAGISSFLFQKRTTKVTSPQKIRRSLLASTFAVFIVMFIITHMVPFPGGAKSLHAVLGNQPLFDQHVSYSADEVYRRLEGFGDLGRTAYKSFTFGGDLIFPLSLFVFLTVLAYFVRERTSLSRILRLSLISVPILWFYSDMIENSVIYFLLSQYPQKNIFLAGSLGAITLLKFVLLLLSIMLPAITYAFFRK